MRDMMKRRYKKYSQYDFAALLEIDPSRVSRLLNGIDPVSWPVAAKLSQLFPGRDVIGWKNATKEDLNRLYQQLKSEAKEKVSA